MCATNPGTGQDDVHYCTAYVPLCCIAFHAWLCIWEIFSPEVNVLMCFLNQFPLLPNKLNNT